MTEKKIQFTDLFPEIVGYKYIPKMDNKIGIENVNFIAEIKTIEKANSFKYFIIGINSLYFYLIFNLKFQFLKKIKPVMIVLLPTAFYSYGLHESRKEIKKIMKPLFEDEFLLYKAGVGRLQNKKPNDNYLECIIKIN